MINLDLGNIYIDGEHIRQLILLIKRKGTPEFTSYKEDLAKIKQTLRPYAKLQNLVIIGHGGSINSFKALYHQKLTKSKKRFVIINSNEPEFISDVKKTCSKNSTLVMPISKSGETMDSIEALLAFDGYKTVAITENKPNTLFKMAKKRKWPIIFHPDIGGRYSGISSCAYAPLIFMGLDVARIDKGAKQMYKRCCPETGFEDNPSLQLAMVIFVLELQGYTEVYLPVYSTRLTSFFPLIIQLMHESVCKSGKGVTFYGDMGPECQHHTNQRFFGGRKNVMGLFVRVKDSSALMIKVPKDLAKVDLRGSPLGILDKLPYAKSIDFEFLGVREHTIHYKIPYAVLTVDGVLEESLGALMAFWHYVAIYSSWLRNVDPFDQPEVEFAKKHSFELTRNYRR